MHKDLDEVLVTVGHFGTYQRLLFISMGLAAVGVAFHNFLQVFTAAVPGHICTFNGVYDKGSGTRAYWQNGTYHFDVFTESPYEQYTRDDNVHKDNNISGTETTPGGTGVGRDWFAGSCEIYRYYELPSHENDTKNYTWMPGRKNTTGFTDSNLIKCTNWNFNKSQYQSTIATEWNLVCRKKWLLPLALSFHMLGCLVGSVIFGNFADRFGRRKGLLITTVMEVVGGIVTTFSVNYYMFVALQFFVGMAVAGTFNCAYIIVIEFTGAPWRAVTGTCILYFYSLGAMILALMGYFIRDWKTLQLVASSCPAILLTYFWIAPESPRWLLQQGKVEEAEECLRKVGRINGIKPLPEFQLKRTQQLDNDHERKYHVIDLLRFREVRSYTLKMSILWFVMNGVSYGLTIHAVHMGGNDYINLFLCGAVEILANTACLFVVKKFSRRASLGSSFLLTGLALLLTGTVHDEAVAARITLAMIGKLGITCTGMTLYPFTAEIFPTVLRTNGLGVCSMAARIGGLVVPFVQLLKDHGRMIPLLVFGGCAFMSSVLALLLPETSKRPLPDTVEDATNIQESHFFMKGWCQQSCCRKQDKPPSTTQPETCTNSKTHGTTSTENNSFKTSI